MANFYVNYPPSGGGSSANASVGLNGSPAPTSSTEIGFIDGSGNEQGVSATNPLPIHDAAPVTPAGSSTSANQVLEITQLTGIHSDTTSIDSKTPTVGQKSSAASRPVVIASDQSPVAVTAATWPLPAGASTAGNQITGNNSLASIDSKTPALGQQVAAASQPVVLTAAQITTLTPLSSVTVTQATGTNLHAVLDSGSTTAVTQATAASLNATVTQGPAGAAAWKVDGSASTQPISGTVTANAGTNLNTSALALETGGNLAAINTKTPALGQAAMAASSPVVIASNQSTLPIANQTDSTATGSLGALNATVVLATNGAGTAMTEISGTWSGTITFQGSNNAFSTFQAITSINISSASTQSATTTANGFYSVVCAGFAQVRAIMTAYTSGSAAITMEGSAAHRVVVPLQGIPANLQATVTTAGKSKVNLARNDYSGTSVTTAAYVQLIASTASAASLVELFDSSGQTLVLAVGAAASEVDQFYINPGGNGQVPLSIPAGSRVSIKAVTATAAAGYINLTLYS